MVEFGVDMETLVYLWNIFTTISSVMVLLGSVCTVILVSTGFLPALWRLGNGLKRNKIAVFAKGDELASLTSLLRDTKLFNNRNIVSISTPGDIGRAEGAATYLVFWPDWQEQDVRRILTGKGDRVALVVFAPQGRGRIPDQVINDLENHRNVVLVNFRGRLLNDIIVSMITTGHE